MKLEILTTTMFLDLDKISEFLNKMNVQSDIIIANQCDLDSTKEFDYSGFHVKIVSTATRGVSTNRNIAIRNSTADILLFTDDDVRLTDGYVDEVLKDFENSNADCVKYFCGTNNPLVNLAFKKPKKFKKINMIKIMSAGMVGFAARKNKLLEKSIYFNENIGPGKEINHGEDGVFFKEIFKNQLSVYVSPFLICNVDVEKKSTWFSGFDDTYLITNGYIYYLIYGPLSLLAIIRRAFNLKMKKRTNMSFNYLVKKMNLGRSKARKGYE